jgi:hypothetical protein
LVKYLMRRHTASFEAQEPHQDAPQRTDDAEVQSVIDGMGEFLADRLSRYKHPGKVSKSPASACATMPARFAAR